MIFSGLVVLFSSFGQAGDLQSGRVPYEIFMKGDERIFAFINPSDLQGNSYQISIMLDEPWRRPSDRVREIIRKDIVGEPELERSPMRKNRLKNGWEAHGGEQTETASGLQWVLKSEVELSKRAQAMAADPVVIGEPLDNTQSFMMNDGDGGMVSPGFLELWGVHIAVGGVSILGIALAAWWGFFRMDWASL